MTSVLTVFATVLAGVLTFVGGQIIVKAVLEPAIELKKLIGRIAYDLDFYANQMYGDQPLADEARDKFRQHACDLREKLNVILWYRGLSRIFALPAETDVYKASAELIGQSNLSRHRDPSLEKPRDRDIKVFLKIRT